MAAPVTGRPAIFRPKDRARQRSVGMTKTGWACFHAARRRLAQMVGVTTKAVSVADTFEYLARGDEDTRAYLRATGQIK